MKIKALLFLIFLWISTAAAGKSCLSSQKMQACHNAYPHETQIRQAPKYALFTFAGISAGDTRMVEIIPQPWAADYGHNYLLAGAASYTWYRTDNMSFEGEMGLGFRFPIHSPETWFAIYVRYNNLPWNNYVYTTVAINTGISVVGKVSKEEKDKGERGNPKGSRLLHYLGPEITFALPRDHTKEVVIRLHHRSGAMGTFGGVWGGSNVVSAGFRFRF